MVRIIKSITSSTNRRRIHDFQNMSSTHAPIDDAVMDIINGRAKKELEKASKNTTDEKKKKRRDDDPRRKASKNNTDEKKKERDDHPRRRASKNTTDEKKKKKKRDDPRRRVRRSGDSSGEPTTLEPGPSIGSIAPAPPALCRSEGRLEVRPGAVAVPGVLSSSGSRMIPNNPNSGISRNDQRRPSSRPRTDHTIESNNCTADSDGPPFILVNAHLVSSEQDIEQAAEVRVVDPRTTLLVKAEPLGDIMMMETRKAGLRELLKSRTVQLCLVVLCLIICGLVIGVIAGSGSPASNYDDNDDYTPSSSSTTNLEWNNDDDDD
jgi:hypothetical protein